ncbi:MAG: FkbM family methyltransferase [Bacteroidota bacterium]|nr:FkbM family methyltransferase [Bacteroidota bacterium]
MSLKRLFKRNTHNFFFRALGDFGIAMIRFYENRNHDIYSNGELTLIRKLTKLSPSLVIDGGANTGNYSLMVNRFCGDAKILSFEPVEQTFNILKENTKDSERIKPVRKGLFSSDATKKINIFPLNTHSSIYDIKGLPYDRTASVSINMTTGDSVMKEYGINYIDLLKLDLEGAEYEALKGFSKAFENKQIRMIQFEYGYINITTRKLLLYFYEFFEQYGYIIGKVFPKTVEFRPYKFKYEDFTGPNFVAVHKDDLVLRNLIEKNCKGTGIKTGQIRLATVKPINHPLLSAVKTRACS